ALGEIDEIQSEDVQKRIALDVAEVELQRRRGEEREADKGAFQRGSEKPGNEVESNQEGYAGDSGDNPVTQFGRANQGVGNVVKKDVERFGGGEDTLGGAEVSQAVAHEVVVRRQ